MPPTIKQQVATNEGHCKVDKPMIACPLVQPPAYLVPNPTINPPKITIMNPLRVANWSQLNTSAGTKAL